MEISSSSRDSSMLALKSAMHEKRDSSVFGNRVILGQFGTELLYSLTKLMKLVAEDTKKLVNAARCQQ